MTGKLFIFTHGVGGSPESCFIPFLRRKLEEMGHQTHAPAYPNSCDPDFPEWRATFEEDLSKLWNKEDDIVLVAHSLGGYFVLRLLGECSGASWTKKVCGVVLVAPTSTKRPNRRKFYSESVKWSGIRSLSCKVILLYSDNDSRVSPEHSALVVSELGNMPGFEFMQPSGYDHFIMREAEPVTSAVLVFG